MDLLPCLVPCHADAQRPSLRGFPGQWNSLASFGWIEDLRPQHFTLAPRQVAEINIETNARLFPLRSVGRCGDRNCEAAGSGKAKAPRAYLWQWVFRGKVSGNVPLGYDLVIPNEVPFLGPRWKEDRASKPRKRNRNTLGPYWLGALNILTISSTSFSVSLSTSTKRSYFPSPFPSSSRPLTSTLAPRACWMRFLY